MPSGTNAHSQLEWALSQTASGTDPSKARIWPSPLGPDAQPPSFAVVTPVGESASKSFWGLCGREKHGTMERDWYGGPHHSEQNAHASRSVEPLERAHKISKRPRQDTNCLPHGETRIEERQAGFVGAGNEGFHDALRDRDRPLLAGK